MNKEIQKKFILDTLLPYLEDPSTCGFDTDEGCLYLTKCGKMCAVGQHMKKGEWQTSKDCFNGLMLEWDSGEEFLTEEALSMEFSDIVWTSIQDIHDAIAQGNRYHYSLKRLEEVLEMELNELREIN